MAKQSKQNKQRKPKPCAYCGATDRKLTRDHIVPQALWHDRPLPLHTRTVPACEPCQAKWDKDANYFRNIIVMTCDPRDHPAIMYLAQGAIKRRFLTSGPDRNDLTRNAMSGYHQPSPDSLIYEPGIRIDIERDRFYRTPEKIVRGFFFFRNGIPVPDGYDVRIYPGNGFWRDNGFQHLLASMEPWKTMGDDIFAMRATRDDQDSNFTVWLMRFFTSSAILGYTCPRSYGTSIIL